MMRANRTAIDVSPEPSYSGAAKAALVLLAMDRSQALELLKSLAPEDVRAIMRRAAELKLVEGTLLDAIITEFELSFNEGVNFIGSADEVRLLVEEALGNDGANLALTAPAVVEAPLDPPWTEVGQLSDDVLVAYILGQHPQAAAFLLANLEQDRAPTCCDQWCQTSPTTYWPDCSRSRSCQKPSSGRSRKQCEKI